MSSSYSGRGLHVCKKSSTIVLEIDNIKASMARIHGKTLTLKSEIGSIS